MAKYEVSTALINQLQISLRNQAGLPSFSPSDLPPPSSPPSILPHAIAAVGSNPDALRCTHCNGELLRGSQSIFCVYCARFLHNSQDFNPISFTSTLGFQWFLRSLSLDGSESVERLNDGGTESGRGHDSAHDSAKDEIPLSKLLDLQLQWPDESIRFDVENEHGKRWSKLVGVDIDELFRSGESLEHSSGSSNKQVVASENSKTEDVTTFSGQSNLNFFEKETRSGEGENDEESDWAAEFQSADADVKVDHGSHLNFKQENLEKNNLEDVSFTRVLSFSDTAEPKSGHPVDPNQSERIILVKDDEKGIVSVDDGSLDWLPAADKQSKSITGDPSQVEKSDVDWHEYYWSSGGPDPSDSWNDFTGSVGAEHNQLDKNLDRRKSAHSGGNEYDFWDHTAKQDVSVESTQNVSSNQTDSVGLWSGTSKGVDDSYDVWNDFKSSALKHDNQPRLGATEAAGTKWAAEGDGIFKGQHIFDGLSIGNKEQQPGSSEAIPVKISDGNSLDLGNGDSLDMWSDFARSDGASVSKPIINDPLYGAWSDVSGLMVTHVNQPQISDTMSAENQTFVEDDSAFGSWSDFRTSQMQVENNFSGINLAGSTSDEIHPGKDSENLTSVEDKNMRNSWGDFVWSTSSLEQQSHAGGAMPFENNLISEDLFGFHNSTKESISSPDNQFKSDGSTFLDGKLAGGNVEAIDAWTDFASSSDVPESSWLSSNASAAFNQLAVKHDSLDAWNVIGNASNKPAAKDTAVEKGKIPEFDVVDTGNSQFVGSNSSLHPDPFQGLLNDINGPIQLAVSHTEAPNLVRTETGVKADDLALLNGSGRVVDETSDPKSSVVETLISEMHDLSFMLESNLSVPKSGT